MARMNEVLDPTSISTDAHSINGIQPHKALTHDAQFHTMVIIFFPILGPEA